MLRKTTFKYRDLLFGILYICIWQAIISDYLGFKQVNYLCDFFLCLIVMFRVKNRGFRIVLPRGRKENVAIFAFGVVVLIGWMLNPTPPQMALWGLRNYGRFFLFYMLAIDIWNEEDAEKIENIFLKLFPIHMVLLVFQYAVEGLQQDRLSGLFGNKVGGNGGLVIYLTIILCIIVGQFDYKKIGWIKFLAYLLMIFVNAALSELKFLFVLAAVLMAWYLIMTKRKDRAIILVIFFVMALFAGVQLLYYFFPGWTDYLSIKNIAGLIKSQKVYATQTDIGRTAVFSKLAPIITDWEGKDALFVGIGLGNGDYSSAFSFLNSAFYKTYEATHYTWLSLGYLFVETGFLGTIAYVSFFVILEWKALLAYRRKKSYFSLMSTFYPLVALALIVYNSTMRSNFAYMMFTVLAFQALANKKVAGES